MTVQEAIATLYEHLAYLTRLAPNTSVNLEINFNKPRHIYREKPLDHIQWVEEGDEVFFKYFPNEVDFLNNAYSVRVGSVVKHDYEKCMTMLYDYERDAPRWFKWDKIWELFWLQPVN